MTNFRTEPPFDRARSIYEEIKVRVYGPLGSETPTCAEALTTAGLIAELHNRVEALEAGLTTVSLELRARVEWLEAAAKPAESNYPAKPDSSLVDQISGVIAETFAPYVTADKPARAAIHVIADWLDQQELHTAAERLRREVG